MINAGRKENPSTSGMKSSVETSTLLQHRTAVVVPERMALIEAAIAGKDFGSLAEIAMKDSNQFHAICADTFPPIRYMNDYSMAVVALVHAWNKAAGSTVCGYTFDAGPNAVLLCQKPHLTTLMSLLEYYFEPSPENTTEISVSLWIWTFITTIPLSFGGIASKTDIGSVAAPSFRT